jgi:hypothetical protein
MKTLFTLTVFAAMLLQSIGFAAEDKVAGPIQVTVKLDRAEYMHGEPGVTYVMAPTGRLTATLTVKNVSPAEQKLTFSSGQKYDFVIRDAKGGEIKRWSADMMFTQAFADLTMAAGQEHTYKEVINLGEPGKPLLLGGYTLEGIFTCSTPLISAAVPFKIIPTPAK